MSPSSSTPLPLRAETVTVGVEGEGQRIDNYLLGRLKGVPKTRVYRMLRSGEVRLNGGRVTADRRLTLGDLVRIPPVRLPTPAERTEAQQAVMAQKADRVANEIPLLHEGDGLLAVIKPAGLAVHGGSGVSLGLVEALRAARQDDYLELVHRLDRDTSGLLLLATRRSTLLNLHQQLREGLMRKRYLAVSAGDARRRMPNGSHLIKAPLLKTLAPNGERWVRTDATGQASITRVRCLAVAEVEGMGPVSLIQCEPLTGRTHQIRVHLQHLHLPILGDPKYGDESSNRAMAQRGLKRMLLHAWRLELGLGDARLSLEAPLDDDFRRALQGLGLPTPAPQAGADIDAQPLTQPLAQEQSS